jgi:hypothetical protein
MTGYSLNEVEALLTKAARGCGADAAHAARFGQGAVMCLCDGGTPTSVHAALAALPNGVIVEYAAQTQRGLAQAVDRTVIFRGDDPLWAGYLAALPYQVTWTSNAECTVHMDVFENREKPARLTVDPDDMAHWQTLAAKTFVTESEHSRLAGAGAGLTDND